MYGSPSALWYKDAPQSVHRIWSCTGTRQGDPLAGALFALGHIRAIQRTHAAHETVFLPSIADDTFLLGPLDAVKEAYATFVEEAGALELTVSHTKSHQFLTAPVTPERRPFLIDEVELLEGGITVLGAPIGFAAYTGAHFQKSVKHKLLGLDLLPKFLHAQAAHALLTKFYLTRIHYLLRCTPLTTGAAVWTDHFHEQLVRTMELILAHTPGTMRPHARAQMQLPIAKGGLGFVPPSVVAPAAILGSWALSNARIPLMFPGDADVARHVGEAGTGSLPLQTHLQGAWSHFNALIPSLPTMQDIAAEPQNKFQALCSTKHGKHPRRHPLPLLAHRPSRTGEIPKCLRKACRGVAGRRSLLQGLCHDPRGVLHSDEAPSGPSTPGDARPPGVQVRETGGGVGASPPALRDGF